MSAHMTVTMKLRISRQARDRYGLDMFRFSNEGLVVLADFHSARVFAQEINEKRDLAGHPFGESAIRAGQLNAIALIDEILHHVARLYRQQGNPQVMHQAQQWLVEQLDQKTLDSALYTFVHEFPPQAVYQQQITPEAYLAGETDGVPNREILLEEMLMLWLDNMNSATSPFTELFDDAEMERGTSYLQIIYLLRKFFDTQPKFGPENQNLVDMLRSPAVAVPMSLSGQLHYIREKWASLLDGYLDRLLGSLDLLKEEEKISLPGPGPAQVLEFAGMGLDAESEHYSADRDWMPRLVVLAKCTYVWLDQLSRQYQRPINCLNEIPDEELDNLARWGFSGLWLIGLWERSPASQRIKQLTGNPEAVASAYSLLDYQIAADLGGEEAYRNLAGRAWQRGIRLASDMVPNHMGIDSRWVVEHPDWFIGLPYSPFPSYTFNGPDLSSDGRVGIFLEDHYYNRTDAAVVFKRVDRSTGDLRYIYHGNDGTSMPWNDTAQLDYLNPEVREAVIQTILHVARKFPIIRFDAAMTLAKRHVQRLWYPEPGTGGAIASRSEQAMAKARFDAAMPEEFWREVVERVAVEVPDTLLLAEAFWMMEGYFVRTLGMHRVYNSAFMNMLKVEDNAKYRASIKNVLEYDPEILKRFVNFMNNPDEETAVAQFGKDDKYFGVCTMMVTMPGLPMIGHGQVEGYHEKYGMEYRRAYWDEQPDINLVQRHEREIFPLMQRRHIFADVRNFLLYDFYTPEGHVNENVFAYSNCAGDSMTGTGERGLVVYNNKFAEARGWIHTSAAYSIKKGQGDPLPGTGERRLIQKTLGEGLGLHPDASHFCIFRDHISGLEHITSSQELCDEGLYVELGAFKVLVYLDFREVEDDQTHQYSRLTAHLGGRGVPSIEEALREILRPPEQPEPGRRGEPVKFERASGILLHPTSLPGRFGIGDLGDAAYKFVEFLEASSQHFWQIMPLGPTSYGDSPYQALSAFAGNPLLINLERLVGEHWLAAWDFDSVPTFPEHKVDYGPVINFKQRLLRLSFENFKANANDAQKAELAAYIEANRSWLDDYALFAALKDHHVGAPWIEWEQDIATRQPAALERWRLALTDLVSFHHYAQFLFYKQWSSLKAYTNEHGIRIIGDIPLFVAYDSADTWAHQELFHCDTLGKPTLVAGVPPDYFSSTGQLWGNPLYRWDVMAQDGYAWWIARFKSVLQQVDVVRLDHFRGFEACWAVPAGAETAINGEWVQGPGRDLFRAVEQVLGPVPMIAEDLGLITPEVETLREELGFPGMKVLQFAFSGDPTSPYLPHNFERNCVVYTGTHDNDTTLGWLNTMGEEERMPLRQYLGGRDDELNWELIRLAFMSVAHTAIVPLQDVLGVGSEGRMNTPGQASGNWGWRYSQDMLTAAACERLKMLTEMYGRAPDRFKKGPNPTQGVSPREGVE
jgi:4-alpha-glucanotransferase